LPIRKIINHAKFERIEDWQNPHLFDLFSARMSCRRCNNITKIKLKEMPDSKKYVSFAAAKKDREEYFPRPV